jgi:hypothetical protein
MPSSMLATRLRKGEVLRDLARSLRQSDRAKLGKAIQTHQALIKEKAGEIW